MGNGGWRKETLLYSFWWCQVKKVNSLEGKKMRSLFAIFHLVTFTLAETRKQRDFTLWSFCKTSICVYACVFVCVCVTISECAWLVLSCFVQIFTLNSFMNSDHLPKLLHNLFIVDLIFQSEVHVPSSVITWLDCGQLTSVWAGQTLAETIFFWGKKTLISCKYSMLLEDFFVILLFLINK